MLLTEVSLDGVTVSIINQLDYKDFSNTHLEMISTKYEDQTTHNKKQDEGNSGFPCSFCVRCFLCYQLIKLGLKQVIKTISCKSRDWIESF